ncbi:MAG: SBBP repeat-containing protein, partial [Bacteroidota bacterium]
LNGNGYRYATYLGGSGDDIATGIVRDANYIYVTGRTTSTDFPLSAAQAYDASYNGGTDVFVARLDTLLAGAAQLSYSTYIGGSDYDAAEGIGVDNIGRIYVAGATSSANFPTHNALQPVYGGKAISATLGDAFIAKLDPAVLPAVQLQYSTFIGGALSDAVTGLVVDGNGNSFLTGWTASSTYPTTLNAVDTSFGGDSSDVFITKLSPAGKIIYSTFLGGTGGDKANAISIDNKNNIYVAGSTISTNYPVTNAGLFRNITGSGNTDAFVTKLSILQVMFPNGGDTLCAGVNNVITWTGGTTTNYDIYQSSNGGQTFNPLALNVVGNSYTWSTPALFPAGNKYRIKVMTSNGPENDVSDSNFVINTPPRVTQQPSDITQPSGGTATFSVVFAGTPAPAVQWQVDKGAGYTNVAGATSSTLTLNNVQPSQNGWRYRAILTNSCSIVSSNPGTLTVFAVLVTAPNGNEQYCAGSQHAITWTSVSTTGPFDLYLMDENSGALTTIATGVTGNSYNWTIPGNLFGTQYRIQIRLATAQTGDQSDTTFTIKRAPVFVAQPLNQTALKGNSVSFTVSFNETPAPTIQWEVNVGGTWTAIPGATGGTLTLNDVQAAQNGSQYRAVATNICGVSTSQAATLTVNSGGAGVDDATTGAAALRLSISPNPNLGNGMIRFTLPRTSRVELTVADINGRTVSSIADATMSAGDHAVPFNGTALPGGTYLVDLRIGGVHSTVKVTIAK